ncbi:MAG: TldD/PmbA family protein [Chloroflexi bacterium]|nr:TldD/PmbA family protein [Chloroflexota bacterium]
MTEELLSEAKKRYGQAEVYRVRSESHPVSFENNRLKEVMRRDQAGVALRVIDEGRIGFSSTTNPDRESELVERVGVLSKFGSEAKFEFRGQQAAQELATYDPAIESISDSDLIEKGRRLMDAVLSEWPDVLCDVSLGRSVAEESVQNSAGTERSYRHSSYHVAIGAQLIRGTDMLNVWASHSSHNVFGRDQEDRLLAEVLQALANSKNLASAPSGDVPVLFTPHGVAATLLNPLMSGFNGKNVVTGSSPIIGREGEKAFDSRLSVYDNPLLPGASRSRPFDDEGVPSRKIGLIESGVIGEPVFDLQTAGQAGRSSTGSAQRGLASTPNPGISVVDIAPGDTPYTQMLADMRDGLIIEGLLGAGQGNELGGDFRANVALGFRVRNGEIVGRVKDTMISGNVYTVLNNVEAISENAEWVYGSLRAPAIRCRGIELASG